MGDEPETTAVTLPENEEENILTALEATLPDDTITETKDTDSVNLDSLQVSNHSLATVTEEIINLEENVENQQENKAFTDEGTPKISENLEEVEGADIKPPVKQRVSIDETDQITSSGAEVPEINLDMVRASIQDPELLMNAKNIFGESRLELGPVIEISSSVSSIEEEEEIESELITYLAEFGLQPEKEPIDRKACDEQYKILKCQALSLRRKNGLLNRKITEYYRKRKIARVFEEVSADIFDSMYDKYEEKIEDFYEFNIKTIREKEAVDNELEDMINLRDEQQAELVKSFTAMQDREKEIGHGLIDSNTGKAISDKVVERLLARQKAKSEEISKIRLAFIKRRDKVKEIDNKIKALETIGGTLHLMDFEQLRMENQTFSDKIEERDEELMRLRSRYSHAIQALAHIREKINIIEVQIDGLQGKKNEEGNRVGKAREQLNVLKIQRDNFRAQRDKLKANTGILTYPKLLLDMEIGLKQIEIMRNELQQLKTLNKYNRDKLLNIRNTIERTEHVQVKKNPKKLVKKPIRYYKNKPTLIYPSFPKTFKKFETKQ